MGGIIAEGGYVSMFMGVQYCYCYRHDPSGLRREGDSEELIRSQEIVIGAIRRIAPPRPQLRYHLPAVARADTRPPSGMQAVFRCDVSVRGQIANRLVHWGAVAA